MLRRLIIDHEEFMDSLEFFKEGESSVVQFQGLWRSDGGKIATAYRIMSMEYLRKHCLCHIFNSRVNIYGEHLQYRNQIMESIGDPDDITDTKEYWFLLIFALICHMHLYCIRSLIFTFTLMNEQLKIGHYLLGKTIGSGGFARVRGTHPARQKADICSQEQM